MNSMNNKVEIRIIWKNESDFLKAKQKAVELNLPLQMSNGSLNPEVFGNYRMEFDIAEFIDNVCIETLSKAYISDFSKIILRP